MKSPNTDIDFLKNSTPIQLALFLQTGVITKEQHDAALNNKDKSPCDLWLDKFITQHKGMIELKDQVRILSKVNDPVLIIGETGTGKELIAHALHGDRSTDRFQALNCSAIPESLIEAELFGSIKGAFTGSNKDKTGIFESAKDGTVFLDEIGDMPISMQPKLLRAINERKIRRVGGDSEIHINCRFVSATHKDLESNRQYPTIFRDDLFYRISTFIIRTEPLRKRSIDIKPLVESIDEDANIKDLDNFCSLIQEDKLRGNVRSLQQIVRRFVVLGILPHQ